MSAHDVQVKILEPMQRVYIPPRKMEPEDELAALRDYVDALQEFPGDDLAKAWGHVRDTHVARVWPVPGTFKKAANDARRERNEGTGSGTRASRNRESAQAAWERWKIVSRSPMAYEAVKRGVAWSLKCAILYEEKLPEQIDLREFTSRKESAAKTAKAIEDGTPITWRGKVLKPFPASDRATALSMYRGIQMNESRTVAEIQYGVGEMAE